MKVDVVVTFPICSVCECVQNEAKYQLDSKCILLLPHSPPPVAGFSTRGNTTTTDDNCLSFFTSFFNEYTLSSDH